MYIAECQNDLQISPQLLKIIQHRSKYEKSMEIILDRETRERNYMKDRTLMNICVEEIGCIEIYKLW